MKMVNQGACAVSVVGRTFPLEALGEAHQLMQDRDFFGKIVMQH